jgi:hypothetical protein
VRLEEEKEACRVTLKVKETVANTVKPITMHIEQFRKM